MNLPHAGGLGRDLGDVKVVGRRSLAHVGIERRPPSPIRAMGEGGARSNLSTEGHPHPRASAKLIWLLSDQA